MTKLVLFLFNYCWFIFNSFAQQQEYKGITITKMEFLKLNEELKQKYYDTSYVFTADDGLLFFRLCETKYDNFTSSIYPPAAYKTVADLWMERPTMDYIVPEDEIKKVEQESVLIKQRMALITRRFEEIGKVLKTTISKGLGYYSAKYRVYWGGSMGGRSTNIPDLINSRYQVID